MEGLDWKSNRIYYRVSDYDARDDLLDDMMGQVAYLIKRGNWVTCYPAPEDNNLYIIEFAPQDEALNNHMPIWLTPNEALGAAKVAVESVLAKARDGESDKEAISDADLGEGGGKDGNNEA